MSPFIPGDEEHTFCERCHQVLDPDRAVWLELNCRTGRYAEPGTVPPEQSQGAFAFGAACAKAQLAADAAWLAEHEARRTTAEPG